jgi:plastocyanin
VTIRKAAGLAAAAVLGAATVVLPAQAGSETTPTVTAENVNATTHRWTPAEVTVAQDGNVEFSNPSETEHGIYWVSTPGGAPSCESAVPVGTSAAASGTKWKGDCTFAKAGTYTYYCTVHGPAMSGRITVSATGTTTSGPAPTTGATNTGTTPSGAPAPEAGGGSQGTATAGSVLSAVELSARRGAVHGSLTVSSAAAGGTLTIVLRARLAGRTSVVGRLTRTYIDAGAQSWTVALDGRARRTLHRRHRLALAVKVTLTPPGGKAVTLSRALTLHG